MLYFDRIDVSEGTDVNKTSALKDFLVTIDKIVIIGIS